jgi:hypothetical protein
MASYQAVGTGPVAFVDGNMKQWEIPLSAIYFDSNGVQGSGWAGYVLNNSIVDAVLKQCVEEGLLTPGTQAPAPVAFTMTAVNAGTEGNQITVTFSNPQAAPAPGTVTVEVSVTEVYSGLTPATVGNVLGTTAAPGSGLVFVSASTSNMPVAFTGTLKGVASFDCVVPDAGGDAGGAFTVAAASQSADAANIQIQVQPDTPPAQTFTLTAVWSKTAANIAVETLGSGATNPFAAQVTFGGITAASPLPAAGTITLQGGAGATSSAAVAATASVSSS